MFSGLFCFKKVEFQNHMFANLNGSVYFVKNS